MEGKIIALEIMVANMMRVEEVQVIIISHYQALQIQIQVLAQWADIVLMIKMAMAAKLILVPMEKME